jgi:hypothetical protein
MRPGGRQCVKTTYVLIDYENVQPAALTILDQEHVKLRIFVGANQTKIAIEVASALQRMGSRAEYIQISANGPNALDFHIAFYIGQLAAADPGASFHIISKDTGFDPLIQHLKSKKIVVRRSSVVTDIPMVKASTAISSDEQIAAIVADLQRRGTAKPRTVKTLTSTISALFQKKLTEAEVAALIQILQKQKIVQIQETKVSYTLPG